MTHAPDQNPALAALFILSATAFIAGSTLFAKTLGTDVLGDPLHPIQISHGRFLFAFCLLGGAALIRRPARAPVHWRLHLGRTSAGWLGVTLMFAAVAYIPMADATALSFTNPIFAMILAIPLLGERVGPVRWSAAVIAFVGALILLRPTPDSFQPAALLALGAAAVMGLELVFIKKLTGREPVFQVLLVNNLIGICIASVAVVAVWQAPTVAQWGALAGVGVSMACAQILFINGVARADASFAAPFSYGTLIFAAFYDLVLFDVRPAFTSLIGAAIILGGGMMLAWREARITRARQTL